MKKRFFVALSQSNKAAREGAVNPRNVVTCEHEHRKRKAARRCAESMPIRDSLGRRVRFWSVAEVQLVK